MGGMSFLLITLKQSRILTGHIQSKGSLDSYLQIYYICFVEILDILEVTTKIRPNRIKQLTIFDKLIFAITSRILRILMERIVQICSSKPKLQIDSISSVKIFNILEVIGKIHSENDSESDETRILSKKGFRILIISFILLSRFKFFQ